VAIEDLRAPFKIGLVDNTLSTIPTSEWQDRLAARLARGHAGHHSVSPTYHLSGAPLQQRRRLDTPSASSSTRQPNWNEMYTMDALSGENFFSAYFLI